MAAKSCRGLPAELAVKLVVKEASRSRGLKDDTTCLVVDIIPSDRPILPTTPRKKNNMLTSLFIEGNLPVLLTRQQISFRLSVSLKSCSKRVPPCLQRDWGKICLQTETHASIDVRSKQPERKICLQTKHQEIVSQLTRVHFLHLDRSHGKAPSCALTVGRRKMQWKGNGQADTQ